MLEYLTLYEFIVAMLMGLGAFSAFLWGLAGGAMKDVEKIKDQVLRAEGERDGQ